MLVKNFHSKFHSNKITKCAQMDKRGAARLTLFACRVGGEITRFTVTVGICRCHPCHSSMSPMTGLSLRDLSQLDPCVSPSFWGWVTRRGSLGGSKIMGIHRKFLCEPAHHIPKIWDVKCTWNKSSDMSPKMFLWTAKIQVNTKRGSEECSPQFGLCLF